MFKNNRIKILNNLKNNIKNQDLLKNSCLLLKGSKDMHIWDLDNEYERKIEYNFLYTFGCKLTNTYGLINLENSESVLIFPKMTENEALFLYHENKELAKEKYGVNNVIYFDELNDYLKKNNISNALVLNNYDLERKSPSGLDLLNSLDIKLNINDDYLYSCINECRCIKSEEELDSLRIASKISSEAHIEVIKNTKIGMYEYQLQSIFINNLKDCEGLAYGSICAGGSNASVLHYINNDQVLNDNELVLNDMGGQYNHFCSDITCTYPINGKFTEKQKEIYNIVLKAHDECAAKLKVGANMKEIQQLTFKIILQGVIDLGLVKGDFDELFEKKIFVYFMMHSLGHYIGLRVHDVGIIKDNNIQPGEENFQKSRNYLAITQVESLKENMVTTIEPGIYFNERFIDKAKAKEDIAKFFDFEKIKSYQKEVGGVRIEDIYIIKKDGSEKITFLPRTVSQIELCMKNEDWEKLDRFNY